MADILIRGMGNIPVGQEFVIVENIDFERYLYNRETGAAFHLVPLPEGYGRLIDADERAECVRRNEWLLTTEKNNMLLLLRNARTIVPAEGGNADDNS